MADPFSIIASSIGVADILFKLGKYLVELHKDSAHIDQTVRELRDEIAALSNVVTAIKDTFQKETGAGIAPGVAADPEAVGSLWERVDKTLQLCLHGVENLDIVVRKIFGRPGSTGTSKIESLLKAHTKRTREDEIRQVREQIATHQRNLQILLAAIQLYVASSYLIVVEAFADNEPGRVVAHHKRLALMPSNSYHKNYTTSIEMFAHNPNILRNQPPFPAAMKHN